jgi:hypothetical protein
MQSISVVAALCFAWLVGWYLEVQRDQREYKAFEILHQVVKVLQALWISALVYFE